MGRPASPQPVPDRTPAKGCQISCEEPDHEASRNFKVPIGRTLRGRLVRAQDALPGISYRCPGCAAPLILRKGEIRSAHFAHQTLAACSPETALHRGTKAWIASLFRRRLRRSAARLPKIKVPCQGTCRSMASGIPCRGTAWFNLGDLAFDEVIEEGRTEEGLRPDVLLLERGIPVLGIEVRVTHAVGPEKAARTAHPWIEMEAMAVVDHPMTWEPCSGRLPWIGQCKACQRLAWVRALPFSDQEGPEDCLAEFAAASFAHDIGLWLADCRDRRRPAFTWSCPHCGRRSKHPLSRGDLTGVARASHLGPPIRPAAVLHLHGGMDLLVIFLPASRSCKRRGSVWLDRCAPQAVHYCTLDRAHPLAPTLVGTSRPSAFPCLHCGGDCAGSSPLPWSPVPWAEALSTDEAT